MDVCKRFLRYVAIDTQSDQKAQGTPSTPKQAELAKLIEEDLVELGVQGVTVDKNAYVYGFLPASVGCEDLPSIGLIAHLDTSPDVTAKAVKPRLVRSYDGKDIVLNHELNIVSGVEEFPALKKYVGKDLIVTDGTTLLGADDKGGIAEIICALEAMKDIEHGRVAVCFTPDEEINHGASLLRLDLFACDYAYTVDGGELGELSCETFNASSAKVQVHGLNIHTGTAKGVMKNASMIAMEFDGMLPQAERPEHTGGYEGFFHLSEVTGNESGAELAYLIRDHDRERFVRRKDLMQSAAAYLNEKYGQGTLSVEIRDSYYNMFDMLKDKMYVVDRAIEAMRRCGVEPNMIPIRGGTDGSALSYRGLPCPNLGVGGLNYHGINETVCVQSMEKVIQILVEIVRAQR